nr:uncharacterized protein I303_06503 [Kwoniella dejecticola CBS 10117]OBR82945.1 hypothetical protein I303_06503 [Kwoniella dejecticola CBS 10117]
MRTVCYQPGELEQPDLTEFSMVENADQVEAEQPSPAEISNPATIPSSATAAAQDDGKVDNGLEDIRLESSEMNSTSIIGKVAA